MHVPQGSRDVERMSLFFHVFPCFSKRNPSCSTMTHKEIHLFFPRALFHVRPRSIQKERKRKHEIKAFVIAPCVKREKNRRKGKKVGNRVKQHGRIFCERKRPPKKTKKDTNPPGGPKSEPKNYVRKEKQNKRKRKWKKKTTVIKTPSLGALVFRLLFFGRGSFVPFTLVRERNDRTFLKKRFPFLSFPFGLPELFPLTVFFGSPPPWNALFFFFFLFSFFFFSFIFFPFSFFFFGRFTPFRTRVLQPTDTALETIVFTRCTYYPFFLETFFGFPNKPTFVLGSNDFRS